MKKVSSNISSKKQRKIILDYYNDKDYDNVLELSKTYIKNNPKNYFGYEMYLKSFTNNYTKFINDDDLKELKNMYEQALLVSNKSQKKELKKEYDEYLYDLKEVENLKKIKKDLSSKYLLKKIYNECLVTLNNNIRKASNYNEKGLKIKNIYDFINGIFLLSCLIFNLFNVNLLLLLTIPLGIFGIVNIYSFIDSNILNKDKSKNSINSLVEEINKKVLELKKEIQKNDELISFLQEQKKVSINKIPAGFAKDVNNIFNDDEEVIASEINNALFDNNIVYFTTLLGENTYYNTDEITNILEYYLFYKEELISYSDKRKNKQNKLIYMKSIKKINIIYMIFIILISLFSIILLTNEFNLNSISFIFGIIFGVLNILIYNINTGKHNSLYDTFYDNLIYSVFSSSLVYNLVYTSHNNDISFIINFIKVPVIFALILSGFCIIISYLKYSNLLKRLRM